MRRGMAHGAGFGSRRHRWLLAALFQCLHDEEPDCSGRKWWGQAAASAYRLLEKYVRKYRVKIDQWLLGHWGQEGRPESISGGGMGLWQKLENDGQKWAYRSTCKYWAPAVNRGVRGIVLFAGETPWRKHEVFVPSFQRVSRSSNRWICNSNLQYVLESPEVAQKSGTGEIRSCR